MHGAITAESTGADAVAVLPTPLALRAACPVSPEGEGFVARVRAEVEAIVAGRDDRLLVVVGPCSVHDPAAALDYAARLAPLARAHAGELLVLMRTYFEKARTHLGWKGYLNDPHMDGSHDLAAGLTGARRLLVALAEQGLGAATEVLDPLAVPYLGDLISWAAIGARTSESQPHRELASGLPVAVGFKNGTDGSPESALWAVKAAAAPHVHLAPDQHGRLARVRTSGNRHGHLVLRGGRSGPNYSEAHVAAVLRAQASQGVPCAIVVDCSHGNSDKRPERQPQVASDVAAQVARGQRALCGVMLESQLVAGRQDHAPGTPLRYGQSITDACIDLEVTAACFGELAGAVRKRRALPQAAGARAPSPPPLGHPAPPSAPEAL